MDFWRGTDVTTQIIVVSSVLGGAWLVLMVVAIVLCCQVSGLKRKLAEMQTTKIRVQKLKLNNDKSHAFHNPAISPDEELSRRGYSMYQGPDAQSDVESGRHYQDRHQERQTGGQFVEELIHELDNRQQRQQTTAPPFLLHSIQENKTKTRGAMNPMVDNHGRQSDTNPNFIY